MKTAKSILLLLRGLIIAVFIHRKGMKVIDPSRVRSICLIRIDRIGDLVVSLPAIQALAEVFPAARVSVLARPASCSLLKGLPGISVIPYKGFFDALRTLRSGGFSLVVDLLFDYPLKTALLAYASGAEVTAGFDIHGRGRFFSFAVSPSREKKTMSGHVLDLVRQIARGAGFSGEITDDRPRLTVSDDDAAFAVRFLDVGQDAEPGLLIGIHPGGYYASQRWDKSAFAELAARISGAYQCRIIVLGEARDSQVAEAIILAAGRSGHAAIGLPLNHLAAVIGRLNLLICNNSGPLHIAASLDIPTVSTMGPTDSELWYPSGEKALVVRQAVSCSPCGKGVCRDHRCMSAITVEKMYEAVRESIRKFYGIE